MCQANLKAQKNIQWNFKVYNSVAELPDTWEQIASNSMLIIPYLRALEENPPLNMQFFYVLIEHVRGIPAGILYFQMVPFEASRSINYREIESFQGRRYIKLLKKWNQSLKWRLAEKIKFSTLVCGNLLLTGAHGWKFADFVNETDISRLLSLGFSNIESFLRLKGWPNPPVQLIKEFYPFQIDRSRSDFKNAAWIHFQIQPTHILRIRPHWICMSDYLSDLQSKYRVRYRRAKKKLEGISMREMGYLEMAGRLGEMERLYQNIASRAGFNMVNLDISYLVGVKESLRDEFKVLGYFKNTKLIGFFTYFQLGDSLDAHYIGLDRIANLEHQLYLNMLFFLIEQGIVAKVKYINFGRTAPEIKSSVGAETIDLDCFIRHKAGWVNKFVPALIAYLQPKEIWQERHPFTKHG